MKIKIKNLLIVFAFSAAGVFAQSSPTEILENSRQAIGGAKEIAKIKSLRAFADCRGPNGDYTTEIHSALGGRLIFEQVRASGQIYRGQTSGRTFWLKDEKTGAFTLADARAAFAWRAHDFQFLAMEIDRRFRDFAFAGEEPFGGVNALKLNATDELGNPASLFFDKKSRLLRGFVIQNPFDKSETIRTVFNEWRRVGNLRLPSKVTATDRKGDFVLHFREISLNKADEKTFVVPVKVAAMNELLELQKNARAAHFTRNAKMLVSTFADDFANISGGKISKPSRGASIDHLQKYFDDSTFIEWDDIAPPVIEVSDDATLGYVLVHKKVRLLSKSAGGKEETEIFAWIETYRKIKGEWKLTAVVSTKTPEND
ncbi:MAG TPA: hypothetical protein VIL74_12195 [Pyrinomonadaceae bacterium]|jgi:hypothetical protein